jgi:hypothetical protein
MVFHSSGVPLASVLPFCDTSAPCNVDISQWTKPRPMKAFIFKDKTSPYYIVTLVLFQVSARYNPYSYFFSKPGGSADAYASMGDIAWKKRRYVVYLKAKETKKCHLELQHKWGQFM